MEPFILAHRAREGCLEDRASGAEDGAVHREARPLTGHDGVGEPPLAPHSAVCGPGRVRGVVEPPLPREVQGQGVVALLDQDDGLVATRGHPVPQHGVNALPSSLVHLVLQHAVRVAHAQHGARSQEIRKEVLLVGV
eukprot:CAMPEP_0179121964 /NCGR_PEP_ID=MMETSP0796-20121207/57542_1 /TAXON_ID=73915 /ORGANISM="Pyrodinium bahamense, Strain pbaha01" /LENGTH=136 /DNA_ID=CAMNT_0020820573 /DNA_START=117 /DNA_END=527 /DNA_ORIENTATION=+